VFVLQVCDQCRQRKDESKFDGHRICWTCRSAAAPSLSSTNITLHPRAHPPLFDDGQTSTSHLSFISRAAIIVMEKLGFDRSQIVHWIGCDQRTVDHWTDHFNRYRDVEEESRSGRPTSVSTAIDEAIVSLAEEKKFITPKIIRYELGLPVSARTIRRRLDDAGLFGRVARFSYPFTDEHIARRFNFAQQYKNWDEAKWDAVLFSDETYIVVGGDSQIWVQRPEDTAFLEKFMTHKNPFSQKIGIWAAFSSQGTVALKIFDETMTTALLKDTFRHFMLPAARRFWPNQQWFLLQDNAPYHTSTDTQAWLHNNGVDCIDFPPYSPDLNPIENLWAELKRCIDQQQPRNIEELKKVLNEEWNRLDNNYLSTLSHSMIQRCQVVIVSRGFKTKY
jgi:transposase